MDTGLLHVLKNCYTGDTLSWARLWRRVLPIPDPEAFCVVEDQWRL
jgi:hypothetical protein